MSPPRPQLVMYALAGAIGAVLFLLGGPTGPREAQAEPRFAVREGVHCSVCHINQTGGGMRTAYGSTFSQTDLPSKRIEGVYLPDTGSYIRLGANLRLGNRTILKTETQLGDDEFVQEASNSFEISEGNIYVQVEPVPGKVSIYIDETVTPEGASSREAFLMVYDLPLGLYAKAGRFMLPYGLRVKDDRAFIRQQTGFTYADQDLGLEIGMNKHPLQWSVAFTNGGGGFDPNIFKRITGSVSVAGPWIRGGGSFSYNDTSTDEFLFRTWTWGGHLGFRLGRFLLMGEFDWIHGLTDAEPYDQYAIYAGVDFEPVKGLYMRFRWEGNDPLESLDENERDRFLFGLSWFPVQSLELRAEYRMNRDIPQRVDGNADEIIVELHGFL